jgi:hypothetical protein
MTTEPVIPAVKPVPLMTMGVSISLGATSGSTKVTVGASESLNAAVAAPEIALPINQNSTSNPVVAVTNVIGITHHCFFIVVVSFRHRVGLKAGSVSILQGFIRLPVERSTFPDVPPLAA